MSSVDGTAGYFWGSVVSDYDDLIRRLVSPYPEMVWALLHYLPQEFCPRRILELGCGTGNLTRVLREKWPNASIVCVDASPAMLEQTKAKVGGSNLELIASSFEALELDAKPFDLVTSSLALHHLPPDPFQAMLTKACAWLTPGGLFGLIDCVRAESERLYLKAEEHWIALAKQHGVTDEEMAEQIAHHRAHDHYPVLTEIPTRLSQAGFQDVDILWRHCIWAVIQARKPFAEASNPESPIDARL